MLICDLTRRQLHLFHCIKPFGICPNREQVPQLSYIGFKGRYLVRQAFQLFGFLVNAALEFRGFCINLLSGAEVKILNGAKLFREVVDLRVILKCVNFLRFNLARCKPKCLDLNDHIHNCNLEFLFNRVGGLEFLADSVREFIAVGYALFKIFREIRFAQCFQPDKPFRECRFNGYVLALLDFIAALPQFGL